jgi:hypothetical protein
MALNCTDVTGSNAKAYTPKISVLANLKKADEGGQDAPASFTFPAHSRGNSAESKPASPIATKRKLSAAQWEKTSAAIFIMRALLLSFIPDR